MEEEVESAGQMRSRALASSGGGMMVRDRALASNEDDKPD